MTLFLIIRSLVLLKNSFKLALVVGKLFCMTESSHKISQPSIHQIAIFQVIF